MTKNVLTVFCLLFSLHSLSQEKRPYPYSTETTMERALLIGFNQGAYTFADIGYALNNYGVAGHHAIATAKYAGSEILVGKDFIIGPKIGFHTLGGLALGGSAIYYTNFKAGSFVLRPEFGVGLERFKMVYGYNFRLNNKDFGRFNRHLFSFAYLLTLKTLKTKKSEE